MEERLKPFNLEPHYLELKDRTYIWVEITEDKNDYTIEIQQSDSQTYKDATAVYFIDNTYKIPKNEQDSKIDSPCNCKEFSLRCCSYPSINVNGRQFSHKDKHRKFYRNTDNFLQLIALFIGASMSAVRLILNTLGEIVLLGGFNILTIIPGAFSLLAGIAGLMRSGNAGLKAYRSWKELSPIIKDMEQQEISEDTFQYYKLQYLKSRHERELKDIWKHAIKMIIDLFLIAIGLASFFSGGILAYILVGVSVALITSSSAVSNHIMSRKKNCALENEFYAKKMKEESKTALEKSEAESLLKKAEDYINSRDDKYDNYSKDFRARILLTLLTCIVIALPFLLSLIKIFLIVILIASILALVSLIVSAYSAGKKWFFTLLTMMNGNYIKKVVVSVPREIRKKILVIKSQQQPKDSKKVKHEDKGINGETNQVIKDIISHCAKAQKTYDKLNPVSHDEHSGSVQINTSHIKMESLSEDQKFKSEFFKKNGEKPTGPAIADDTQNGLFSDPVLMETEDNKLLTSERRITEPLLKNSLLLQRKSTTAQNNSIVDYPNSSESSLKFMSS